MSNTVVAKMLLILLEQNALFVGVTLWWMRRNGKTTLSMGLARPTGRQVALGIGLGLLVAAGGHFVGTFEVWLCRQTLPPATFQHLQRLTDWYGAEHTYQQLSPLGMLGFALAGSLAAPIGEEMLFRGMIYNALKKQGGVAVAMMGSALLFAGVHVSPLNLLPLFLMGLVFALVYERTASLWMTICMHAVNNGAAFVVLALTLRPT